MRTSRAWSITCARISLLLPLVKLPPPKSPHSGLSNKVTQEESDLRGFTTKEFFKPACHAKCSESGQQERPRGSFPTRPWSKVFEIVSFRMKWSASKSRRVLECSP